MAGVFVTGTGTGIGKTWVARGVARGLALRGVPVAAIKPVETGCRETAEDARALAAACGRPELASAVGFARYRAPVAPYAATLAGEPACPSVADLATATRAAGGDSLLVVEGAGGLFTPLSSTETIADLAAALALPLLVVAPDGLGCLSAVIALAEAACVHRLPILAVVLTPTAGDDASRSHNAAILAQRLALPVHVLPTTVDDDDALADAVAAITRAPAGP